MHPKDAEGIANSVDPDQIAALGAVWSGSALFAQTCLSENLGILSLVWHPKIYCNHPKSWTRWRFLRIMHPKDAEGIANSVNPDQTAALGAVWSGSALFAQTCLSENLGPLWYIKYQTKINRFCDETDLRSLNLKEICIFFTHRFN